MQVVGNIVFIQCLEIVLNQGFGRLETLTAHTAYPQDHPAIPVSSTNI